MAIKTKTLITSAFFYLLIPFALFCLGFLRLVVAIPLVGLLIWLGIRLAWQKEQFSDLTVGKLDLIFTLVIVLAWVLLSGIGNFAYQNNDFQTRNAIFRDLIEKSWPVTYSGVPGINPSTGESLFFLVYYIGYWLPAAVVGKFLGFQAAHLALFVWTLAGVFLTLGLLRVIIPARLSFVTLLLIFFSGIDIIGFQIIRPGEFLIDGLPITHLEWWAPTFQYSSLTTQLYWVFNQALPVWVCIALFLAIPGKRNAFLLWGFCFFFAPLPAVGFLPFVLYRMFSKTGDMDFPEIKLDMQIFRFNSLLENIKESLSLENVIGLIISGLSFTYYSVNEMSSKIQFYDLGIYHLLVYVLFILLEGMVLWALFYKKLRKNFLWYLVGGMLIMTPLVKVGPNTDFCMRASIAPLFLLMVWSGYGLAVKGWVYRPLLVAVLLLGAITPAFEISRSVFRTFDSTLTSDYYGQILQPTPQEAMDVGFDYVPGIDHPHSMLADDFVTLANFHSADVKNYIARGEGTFFTEFLLKVGYD